MAEAIDEFKYTALLAELESIKGTKKPIHDFIKKVYNLSNKLSTYNKDYEIFTETPRYAFMLITRAMSYDTSVRSVKQSIIEKVYSISNSLISISSVTKDNIAETYEFYGSNVISAHPSTITKLLDVYSKSAYMGPKVTVSSHYVQELKAFSSHRTAAELVRKSYFPDHTITDPNIETTLKEMQDLVEIYQKVIKDNT